MKIKMTGSNEIIPRTLGQSHTGKKVKVNEIVRLCVGGQNFKTTRATLMSDQDCMLAKMFENDVSGRAPATKDEDGYYFIDRSPRYFESILNFLRTGEIDAPANLDLKFLLLEAEYYCIEGMAEKIREELQKKLAYEHHMREHCEQMNCIQQCCQNYLSQIAESTQRQLEMPTHIPVIGSNSMEVSNLSLLQQQAGHLAHFHGHFHHYGHHHHHHHHGNGQNHGNSQNHQNGQNHQHGHIHGDGPFNP